MTSATWGLIHSIQQNDRLRIHTALSGNPDLEEYKDLKIQESSSEESRYNRQGRDKVNKAGRKITATTE
jgi:hypothetical protein